METPELVAIAALIPITLGYRARIRRHPFKACRHCDGYGKMPAGIRGTKRKICPKCGGHGIRRRAWRAPASRAREIARDAKR
jgi:DnaJ-class molecular chaperone